MESGKIIGCVFFVIALFFAIRGMPSISDTERYYRPPGQTERVNGKWSSGLRFNEVSLASGQTVRLETQGLQTRTSMTGTSFSRNTGSCFWILSQKGVGSLRSSVSASASNPLAKWCWQGGYPNISVTNVGPSQVIRYRVVSNGRNAKGVTLASRCNVCGTFPDFADISDYDAIRAGGFSSLGISIALGFFGLVAWIGLPTVMGYLYVFGRSVMPSPKAKAVREEFERAKTGDTFDTRKTYSYARPASNAFRRQQDIDDMDDLTASFKRETERLRAIEARMRAKQNAKQAEYARLVREYEEAIERVEELQEKAAQATKNTGIV